MSRVSRSSSSAAAALCVLASASATAYPVHEHTLGNGVRLWVRPAPGSGQAHVRLVVQAGSADEDGAPSGVAHLLEHVIFDRDDVPEVRVLFDRIEAQGGLTNAFTTADHTVAVADVYATDLDAALELFARSLTDVDFAPARVERHRRVVLRELEEAEADPLGLALASEVWGEHALGRPEGGTPETVAQIVPEDLARSFGARYRSPQTVLVVVADRDETSVVEAAERTVGTLALARDPAPAARGPRPPEGPLDLTDSTYEQTLLRGYRVPSAADGDQAALWLAQEILDHRSDERLRMREPLVYSPAVLLTSSRFPGLLYLEAYAAEPTFPQIAETFDEEIERLVAGGVDERELAATRTRLVRRVLRDRLTPELLAESLVWHAARARPGEPVRDPLDALAAITPDLLRAVAARTFVPARRFDLRTAPSDEAAERGEPVRSGGSWAQVLSTTLAAAVLALFAWIAVRLRSIERALRARP